MTCNWMLKKTVADKMQMLLKMAAKSMLGLTDVEATL